MNSTNSTYSTNSIHPVIAAIKAVPLTPHSMPGLIGISGYAGSGKTTLANLITDYYTSHVNFSFASPLKSAVEVIFTLGRFYQEDKGAEDNYWKLSARELYQFIGTEVFREIFGSDFWIKVLQRKLISIYDSPQDVLVVIDDVRFQEEAEWIVSSGGSMIHLTREGVDGKVGILSHASEVGIDYSDTNLFRKGTNLFDIDNPTDDIYALIASMKKVMVHLA